MALTQKQIDELNAAYYRTGGQTDVDKKNIEYAMTQGWTPPVQQTEQEEQPASSEPTIKQSYGDFMTPETAEEKAYRLEQERQLESARGLATGEVDEATIRANTEKQFQAEIDALNRVYAEKKRQLETEGQGRIGSSTSIQARRGLIGSDFGASQTEKVKQYNQEIINEAEAERAAKEATIRAAARKQASEEYQSKLLAKQQGATAYLEFLKGAAERKSNTIKQTVANMLSEGVDPDSLDSEGLAKELGISVAELKRQYSESKKIIDEQRAISEAEAQKAELEAIKSGSFNLSEGQSRFVYNPLTGETTEIASKGKTYKLSGKTSSGAAGGIDYGTPSDISSTTRLVDEKGKPLKLTATQVDSVVGFDTALKQLQEAKNLIITKKPNTGPISGRLSEATRLANIADPNLVELDALLSSIKANFMKAISGAAVSESEVKRLAKFLPSINDTEQNLQIKIKQFENSLSQQQKSYLSTLGAVQQSQSNQTDLRTKYNY